MAEQTSFDKSLNRLKLIFSILGLVMEPRKCDRWQILKKRCIYIFNMIWLNFELTFAVLFVINGSKCGRDMRELTFVVPCSILSVIVNFKTLLLINYEGYVNDVIDELRELDRVTNDNNVEVKNKIAKEDINFLNFVINLLNVINVGLMINYSFIPLIIIAAKYVRNGELQLLLPFPIVYSFDALNIKYWPYVYMKQIWTECLAILNMISAEYFYYICCTYIRIQFHLLSNEFENSIADENFNSEDNQSHIRDRLKKLIKWHQRLIRATNTLEVIYTKSTLFNFLSSSVIICLVGFNVRNIEDKTLVSSSLTFLSFSLVQIYLLCLFGDMLMTASVEVGDAVYNSLWYAAGWGVAKDLLTVLIRAQTSCKLTAFGFGDVTLRSFSKILSTSWSYFALLNTMYDDNQVQ